MLSPAVSIEDSTYRARLEEFLNRARVPSKTLRPSSSPFILRRSSVGLSNLECSGEIINTFAFKPEISVWTCRKCTKLVARERELNSLQISVQSGAEEMRILPNEPPDLNCK